MVRQGHLIAVVGTFLIGCAVLLVIGCAGPRSETSKKEQGSSPQATDSEERARCEGTRSYHLYLVDYGKGQYGPVRSGSEEDMKKAGKKAGQRVDDFGVYTTNDLPGCPKGGLLLGTDGPDKLFGWDGEDKIRGLGGKDQILGGNGNDVIHAGAGDDDLRPVGDFGEYGDDVIYGGDGDDWIFSGAGFGEDVIYGGDGSDHIVTFDRVYEPQTDKLYCGKGKDYHVAAKNDYVDSSCEKKLPAGLIFGGEA